MNEIEATRAKLKCLEMVEGTDLNWTDVVRYRGERWNSGVEIAFSNDGSYYELALGVVEGKPVWKGDKVYTINGFHIACGNEADWFWSQCSWKPPAPKTIMVELPIDTVIWLADTFTGNVSKICQKALEAAKCK